MPNLCNSILVILLFVSFSFAQTDAQLTWQQYVPNWFPLFAIAAAIGFGITGIAFMLSRVFMLPQLESWARNELFEVVSSVFLVLIIFISLGIIDNIFIAMTNKKPVDYSLNFVNDISNKLMKVYIKSVELGIATGTLSGPPIQYLDPKSSQNLQGSTSQTSGGGSGTGDSGLTPGGNSETSHRILIVAIKSLRMSYLTFYAAGVFEGHYNLIQSIALTSLGISLLSGAILNFINNIAIPVLIPFGLFLSMFSLTRKMGRTLIAFGVGLYIFVPASIIISKTMYDSAFKDNTPPISQIDKPENLDSFTNHLIWLNALDFAVHLGIGLYGAIASKADLAMTPSCIAGAAALSSICGIAHLVCFTAFTMLCNLFVSFSDTGSSLDKIETLLQVASYIKIAILSSILGVPVTGVDQIGTITMTMIGLGMGALVIALVFHLIGPQSIMPNYILPLIQEILNFGTITRSAIETNVVANLNVALADKLTNITLDYTPYVMQYAVPVFLIPFIMIFIVITGIRSLSPAIGGEIQILGISELV